MNERWCGLVKLRGEFVVRQVMDHIVAIPVGSTALQINGMVMLNDVSQVIWESLQTHTDIERIVASVTDRFTVSYEEAKADVAECLDKLRQAQLLEEEL